MSALSLDYHEQIVVKSEGFVQQARPYLQRGIRRSYNSLVIDDYSIPYYQSSAGISCGGCSASTPACPSGYKQLSCSCETNSPGRCSKVCKCDNGATQKCNLSGSICKANNPRASSCSVQTFTNGTCSCKCTEAGTGKQLSPAPRQGTVKSVSSPVSSTSLKPGVIPKAGSTGSPEAEGTGRTGATATTKPATGKFGSFDIATLRAQPPVVYQATAAAAAINRQYADLKMLQTLEGQELNTELKAAGTKAERIQALIRANHGQVTKEAQVLYNELKANATKLKQLHLKWKNAFYASAYAKSPDGLKLNPIKEPEAEQIINTAEQAIKSGTGLSKTLAAKTPGIGIVASPIVSTAGQFLTGVLTGHHPSAAELGANFTKEAKGAATNPGVPDITSSISRMVNENAILDLISGKSVPFSTKEYGVA